MIKNVAISVGVFVFSAITLVGVAFAQTTTPTSTPSVTVSPTTAPSGTVPSGAPATGRAN